MHPCDEDWQKMPEEGSYVLHQAAGSSGRVLMCGHCDHQCWHTSKVRSSSISPVSGARSRTKGPLLYTSAPQLTSEDVKGQPGNENIKGRLCASAQCFLSFFGTTVHNPFRKKKKIPSCGQGAAINPNTCASHRHSLAIMCSSTGSTTAFQQLGSRWGWMEKHRTLRGLLCHWMAFISCCSCLSPSLRNTRRPLRWCWWLFSVFSAWDSQWCFSKAVHDEGFMDHSCLSAAHGTGRRQLLLPCALGLVKPFIHSAFWGITNKKNWHNFFLSKVAQSTVKTVQRGR